MPNVEVALPAAIGDAVLIRTDEFAEEVALVVGWRITRPRFLVGGWLDQELETTVQVLTVAGDETWLREAEVVGPGELVLVSVFLPFTAGDDVAVGPGRSRG
jgi:hypothetical protein